ncbi:MAG TPA: glycosyltransferase family 87 protein [Blastocatellia bacterium]|nr:glycosyltransferase family 87 protein [Blastocatellia bacterium]
MPESNHSFKLLRSAGVPAALVFIGVASALLYNHSADLHRFTQGISAYIATYLAHFALYISACCVVFRFGPKTATRSTLLIATVALVVVFAVVFRARLVGEKDYLSNDAYRYIWDARVQAAGINPYRYLPTADEVKPLRDEVIYPNINRRDYAQTIYPPVAQAIFLATYLIAPSSITAFKMGMSLFDLVTILALMLALARAGMNPARAIIFAWHPLIVWESAHSGHIESAAIAFIALAMLAWSREKYALSGVALALATLIKFYPALLLPLFAGKLVREGQSSPDGSAIAKRISTPMLAAFAATIVVAYLPYLSVGAGVIGYLPGYLKEEGFVEAGSRYFFLGLMRLTLSMPTAVYAGIAALAIIGLGVKLLLREKRDAADLGRAGSALIGLFLMLSTPRYCWYMSWIVPFLCFAPSVGWLELTGASVLLYLLWLTPDYPNIPLWLGAAIYLPALALLLSGRLRERSLNKRGSLSDGRIQL